MGLFRKKNREGAGRDLSFLFMPFLLLLLLLTLFGVGVWIWSTIENTRNQTISEAFMDSFTMTVPGSAEYRSERYYYEVSLGIAGSSLDYDGIVNEVRSHGIAVFDSRNLLREDGELHSGQVKVTIRRIDETLSPETVRNILNQIPGVVDIGIEVFPMAPEMDERMAVSMAIEDAKERGSDYLSEFFGLGSAVVVGIDDMNILYDSSTGYTSVDLKMTVRAEGM